MNQIIIQGIGYLALLCVILSFQKNKRSNILLYLMLSHVLFTLHFSLLHAWTGVAMNILGALIPICDPWYKSRIGDLTSSPLIEKLPL